MFKKAKEIFLQQLKQGATPEGLALTCCLGFAVAIFPFIGSTTLLCLLVGHFFRLNQPVLQIVNYLLYPVQILMLPVFLYIGAWLFQVPPVSFNPKTIVNEFTLSPLQFFSDYGVAIGQGILAWALIAPLTAFLAYRIAVMVLRLRPVKGPTKA